MVGTPGHRAEEPLPPRARLLHVAAGHERVQGERRVAEPAVAVVPVPHAAEVLGQRGRGGGDEPAGRRIREGLQRDERADDRVLPVALVLAPLRPVAPPRLGLFDGALGGARRRLRLVGVIPGERERDALARVHGEVAHGPEVLSADGHGRPQPEGVVSADRADPVGLAAHPRNPRPVVQPEDQLDAHGDGAALTLDHPDEGVRLDRHAVGQHDDTLVGLELGLEDQRARPVAPAHGAHGDRRRDLPPAVLDRPEESGKAGRRVEARNAEPVDGAVPADEGRRLAVPDDRVVLDAQRHGVLLPGPYARNRRAGPIVPGCKTRCQRASRYAAGRPRPRRGSPRSPAWAVDALLGPLRFTAIEFLRPGHSSPWRARDTVSCRAAVSAAGIAGALSRPARQDERPAGAVGFSIPVSSVAQQLRRKEREHFEWRDRDLGARDGGCDAAPDLDPERPDRRRARWRHRERLRRVLRFQGVDGPVLRRGHRARGCPDAGSWCRPWPCASRRTWPATG